MLSLRLRHSVGSIAAPAAHSQQQHPVRRHGQGSAVACRACGRAAEAGRGRGLGSSFLGMQGGLPGRHEKSRVSQGQQKQGRAVRCQAADAGEMKFFPPMMAKPDFRWRLLAMAAYTMPLSEGIAFLGYSGRLGQFAFNAAMKANDLLVAYGRFPLVPIALFFFLFFKCIHNKKLPHFLRFHVLQSIMCEMAFSVRMFGSAVIPQWLFYSTFEEANFIIGLIVFLTAAWSFFFAARGMYGDIPFMSDAVYIQIPVGMDATDPDAGEER